MGEQVLELARRVVKLGHAHGVTVGTAESCTGGLVCAAITAIPGSSAVLKGGVVSYDPSVKHGLLGVPQEVVDDPSVGVVSKECATQMASGALDALGCDVAVSVTGIAGPTGAEPGKPVGTVWFGIAGPTGASQEVCRFAGTRDEVREQATFHALELLCEAIVKQ